MANVLTHLRANGSYAAVIAGHCASHLFIFNNRQEIACFPEVSTTHRIKAGTILLAHREGHQAKRPVVAALLLMETTKTGLYDMKFGFLHFYMTEIIPPFKMSEKNKTLSELQLKSKNQTNFNNCCCVICRRDAVTVGWCRAGVTDCL